MPIPIFNSVASFFLKRRISQIELFKDYPIEVQQEVLRKLVVYSIDTEIGKKFEFKTIRHYNDFKERVPIVAYEDIYEDIERNRKGEQNIFGEHQSSGLQNLVEQLTLKANLFQ